MQLVSKRLFSPAAELLRSRGFTTAQIARSTDRHVNSVSDTLTGRYLWTEWFELGLTELVDDAELVSEIKALCHQARRNILTKQLAELDASS